MIAIALGVYMALFALVVSVFYAASRSQSAGLSDESPAVLRDGVEAETSERDVG